MKLRRYSYRFAEEVLAGPAFSAARDEALQILEGVPLIQVGSPLWQQWRNPNKKPKRTHDVDQDAMNNWLENSFRLAGWEVHPRIVPGTQLEGDYRKERVQVEVQFGNVARYTYDLLKFQVAYSRNEVDVGILAVPVQALAKRMGSNVAYYERVERELPHAKLSITLPILVLGLEPSPPP